MESILPKLKSALIVAKFMDVSFFKKTKKIIEEHSPGNYSLVLAIPVLLLITGFLIWNVYLYTFGFTEDELLKGRFILTGIAFVLISFLSWILLDFLFKFLSLFNFFKYKSNKRFNNFLVRFNFQSFIFKIKIIFKNTRIILVFIFLISWFFIYTVNFFPSIPSFLGGGQPRSLSLISSEKTMPILNSFGIKMGDGAKYQTENLCVVWEDSQGIYILREDRVLMINKSLYEGFGSLPGIQSIHAQNCIQYATQWSKQGFAFATLLFYTNIVNLASSFLGSKKIFFDLVKSEIPIK